MRRDVRDMAVIITGASAGIGRALAVQLARRGARLALAARRAERLETLLNELGHEQARRRHVAVPTDVADEAQCRALIERAVDYFGRIDTLVCNAGFGLIRAVARTTADDVAALIGTNLIGTLECIRATLPRMVSQEPRGAWRGQILIVSSAAARRGLPDAGAYTASKAAQLSIAEALRVELRGSGVAVTTVHPVTTATEFFRAAIRRSGTRPPRRCAVEGYQSPEHVAARMIRAMERPRPEVWPHYPSRILMGLATFAPRVVDFILSKRRVMPNGRAAHRPLGHLAGIAGGDEGTDERACEVALPE